MLSQRTYNCSVASGCGTTTERNGQIAKSTGELSLTNCPGTLRQISGIVHDLHAFQIARNAVRDSLQRVLNREDEISGICSFW